MKLFDLNVAVYAADTASPRFEAASAYWDRALAGAETVALPMAVLVGFVRITTHPRILATPLDPSTAIDAVESWRTRPNVVVPRPTERHFRIVEELLEATGVGGNLVSDAHLAAFAIEYGADLVSYDNDFDRFPGVNHIEP